MQPGEVGGCLRLHHWWQLDIDVCMKGHGHGLVVGVYHLKTQAAKIGMQTDIGRSFGALPKVNQTLCGPLGGRCFPSISLPECSPANSTSMAGS